MSVFFDQWGQCMHGSGLPIPSVEDAREALEFVHKLHSALEGSGAEAGVTIGALIALGAFAGIDEASLSALGQVAGVVATVYISACIACIASVAFDDLKSLFASNELPEYVVAQLNSQGVDLTAEAIA